jgi:outer membrane protein OmpA-like peptidoglycan-associated protein
LGDYWDEPVNLGPVINTPGNESYPFINSAGELLFSSDGHPGLGGKDIFFSRQVDSVWIGPVRLSEPINSPYDDFGIVTDSLMRKGYFSTNRGMSIDIYEFKTLFPQKFYTEIQKDNRYCFNFSDTGLIAADTTNLRYRWSFSDGKEAYGAVVRHCFAGPGKYQVKLDITERGTGTLFFSKLSYTLDLRDFAQPYITGPDAVIAGEVAEFNGLRSSIPGYRITEYTWDFGDGSTGSGPSVRHAFSNTGEFMVNMGVVIKSEKDGSVRRAGISRKVAVVRNAGERDSRIASMASDKDRIVDIREYPNAHILTHFSDEDEIRQNAVFVVEILSSSERLGLNDSRFRVVPQKYSLKEYHDPATGLYSYVAAQNLELTDSYLSFRELHALGFRNTKIKTRVLTDPFERDLYNLMRIYSLNSDLYFDKLDRLSSHAYIMLDQVVNLMTKYPQKRLEVVVHSDNSLSQAASASLTQKRAQLILSYLVKRGVSAGRLIAKGSGSMLPVAPNLLEKDRKLNRRIDFILVD